MHSLGLLMSITGGVALYEMENGAVFRSTGNCWISPEGKWFRVSCQNGCVESTREDQDRILLRKNGQGAMDYVPAQYTNEEKEIGGKGGADARVCAQIADYLQGRVKEPIFDIYRGVTLHTKSINRLYCKIKILSTKKQS